MCQKYDEMKRRTARANNTFLLGSLVMIVLVLVIVVLFLFLSFRIYDKKEHGYTEQYEIELDKSALGIPLSIYINDSLLYSGTPSSQLKLSIGRFALESSLLIVNESTQVVAPIPLSNRSETVTIVRDSNGYLRRKSQ